MQHRAIGGNGAVMPKQQRQGQPAHDKSDLADGGAGKRSLEVDGKQSQNRSQEHGDRPEHQQGVGEIRVSVIDAQCHHRHPQHAGLGQHAGQNGRRRCRRHRVGFRKPDVNGEKPRLCGKPEQRQPGSPGNCAPRALKGGGRRLQFVIPQRAQILPQQKQPHQRRQTADHRYRQIGLPGPHGLRFLFLNHPDIAGQGHHLEAYQCGKQIVRVKHAQRRRQRHQIEKQIPRQLPVMPEVFRRQKARH